MRFAAQNKSFEDMQFVKLHDNDWFKKQQFAGWMVQECLIVAEAMMGDSDNLSLKYINDELERCILWEKCTPTFKGYQGFPAAVCISVNENMVHGIPNDYILKPGDIVKVDLGATCDGVIADAAKTFIYTGRGKSPVDVASQTDIELVKACEKALQVGIDAVQIGNTIGQIGYAISRYVSSTNFKLITHYGGHGLDVNKPHASPFVSNKARVDEGIIIQPGLSIAIEPMLVAGPTDQTKVLKDGWTVQASGKSAHFEHTLFVGEDKVHVMTAITEEPV